MKRLVSLLLPISSFLVLASSASAVPPEVGRRSASTIVPISVIVPGWLRLNITEIPVAVAYDPAAQSSDGPTIPLQASWNLNPEVVRGVEVVSYFADSDSALVGSAGASVAAHSVLACHNSGSCRPFTEEVGGKPSVTVLRESLSHSNAVTQRDLSLTLRLAPESSLRPDVYSGILFFEARCF